MITQTPRYTTRLQGDSDSASAKVIVIPAQAQSRATSHAVGCTGTTRSSRRGDNTTCARKRGPSLQSNPARSIFSRLIRYLKLLLVQPPVSGTSASPARVTHAPDLFLKAAFRFCEGLARPVQRHARPEPSQSTRPRARLPTPIPSNRTSSSAPTFRGLQRAFRLSPRYAIRRFRNDIEQHGASNRDRPRRHLAGQLCLLPPNVHTVDVRIGVSYIPSSRRRILAQGISDGITLEPTARRTRATCAEKVDRVQIQGKSLDSGRGLRCYYTLQVSVFDFAIFGFALP